MNITQRIKQSIITKFSLGQPFDKNDFEDVMIYFPKTRSSQALARLARDKYITFIKIEKFRNKNVGTHYRNIYRVSDKLLAEFNLKPIDLEPKPGDTTIWHSMKTPPANICKERQVYEVLMHNGDIECYQWRGFWPIPAVYIKSWRGVVR